MMDDREFIGIDIGGTNTKIALIDVQGQISHLDRLWMEDVKISQEKFLHQVSEKVTQIRPSMGKNISGIGIAVPGLQRPDGHGTLFSINLPFLNGFDLVHFFSNRFQVPVYVCNDLVAHGLGESQFGSGKGVKRFLCVSLGTGIGHTFIDNGVPQVIMNGISGDSGRMILDVDSNETDMSGVSGSAEALCGVKSIELLANIYCKFPYSTAREVITAARDGESTARQALVVISRRLAHYLMNLSSIYFPEVISVTGGQTEAGDFFIEECRREFARLSAGFFEKFFKFTGEDCTILIQKAKAGGLAGLLGSIVPFLGNSGRRQM